MSEENDQITKNNHIVDIWNDINREIHDIQKEGNFNNIADRAAAIIRVLRQGIERLRRVVGESDTDDLPRSLTDMNKLKKDELAFVVWQFLQWINSDEGCPADKCKDFPCKYRRKQKATCEENLKNGDLDEFGMKEQQDNGFFADFCEGDQQGCWAEYYLWCYRNGYDPLTGKKDKPNNHK
jgi:hypothetical protein